MSVKELTQLKITDLWQEYNRFGDFWEVDTALMKIFLYGASTRLRGEALKPLLGEGVRAQIISKYSEKS